MMYYKNVAEGYEDRKNYQIMQQVGIDNDRIKDTINKQIIWIFALPIIVATIHVIFASKIIFNVLGILNVNHVGVFVTSYVGVIISVVVIYALMYWVTSRIYYMIVNVITKLRIRNLPYFLKIKCNLIIGRVYNKKEA